MTATLQYLYAAYSIPNYVTGKALVEAGSWTQEQLHLACGDGQESGAYGIRGILLTISHEEMIHFLTVNNILMALGESFWPVVPDLPALGQTLGLEVELALEPFNALTLQRLIRFEWPEALEKELPVESPGLEPIAVEPWQSGSLSALYKQIQTALEQLPDLFDGQHGGGGEHHLFLREDFNARYPDYQLQVNDRDSAIFALNFIVSQGEGGSQDFPQREHSHFHQLKRIEHDLLDVQGNVPDRLWSPSYPALRNPTVDASAKGFDTPYNLVYALSARRVMHLFNSCFELSIQLMTQHFGAFATASLRRSKLMNASIDFMTGMMRPLAELLMTMPSGYPGRTAGPSFEIPRVRLIAPPSVALQAIARRCGELAQETIDCNVVPKTVTGMLGYYETYLRELAQEVKST